MRKLCTRGILNRRKSLNMNFKNQVVIVSGSSSGIGAAAAIEFARAGAKVVINFSKSASSAAKVRDKCIEAGGEAISIKADVSKNTECLSLIEKTKKKWDSIDILVNNAGTTKFVKHSDLDGLNSEDFHNMYGLNTVGPFQLIRAARPFLRQSSNGAIVNMSSVAGLRAYGSSVAYAASKAALNSLTLSLARALGPEGIRVNSVCPGFVETDWFHKTHEKEKVEKMVRTQIETTPLQRSGTAEDITGAILFFASDWSKHITGQMLAVDAGLLLGKI